MPTYRRTTRIPAPIDEVWAFHSTVDGLRELTPDWMNLRIGAVEGPNGERDPPALFAGSRIRMSIRPFGVVPRQRWTSRIVEREPDDGPDAESPADGAADDEGPDGNSSIEGSAYFVDEMTDGPFRTWKHTHSFFADGDETLLADSVEYRLPFGSLGDAAGPFAKVGFEGMFRDRHRRTVARFEDA
jgi:ligand-binding SRPBCC domain-containing protein